MSSDNFANDAASTSETAAEIARASGGRLVDRVYENLLNRIRSGIYPPEMRLPSEHALSAEFGVSRPIIRAALGRLREADLIRSRKGSGSFVHGTASPGAAGSGGDLLGFAPVETIADIQRCFEFRLTIEPEAAAKAALRRSEAALTAIEAAAVLLRQATDRQEHRDDADFAFHLAIAEASNNHYYASTLQALRSHVAVGMKLHGLSLKGRRASLETVFAEHAAILAAIRAREPAAAAEAMRSHLTHSRDRLFEGRLLDLSM